MTGLPPDARPRLARKVRLRRDRREGRLFLLYPERGLALNETAAAIVERCDGTRTAEQIAGELCQLTAGAEHERVAADTRAFLAHLAARGLIET
jgi:coenzyme PQQ biosynthesis protein PqqD